MSDARSPRGAWAVLALVPLLAPSLASARAATRCEEVREVRVCGETVPRESLASLASAISAEIGDRAIVIEIREWDADAIQLRADGTELRIPLSDLPAEPAGLDARLRTIALAIPEGIERAEPGSPAWVDDRPLATADDRRHYLGFLDERAYMAAAEPGLWALTQRARGVATLDRDGASLAGELSLEAIADDVVTIGVEIAPAWLAAGERISGGLAGGLLTTHLLFDGDALAIGLYGGVAAIPRPGTAIAGVLGMRMRFGLFDYGHAELRVSGAYADELGLSFGQLRVEVLVPASPVVELLLGAADIAPDLGWAGIEAGVRIWPTGRRGALDFGFEIAAGARLQTFLQRCEFGGCPLEWGAGGPSLALALLSRVR